MMSDIGHVNAAGPRRAIGYQAEALAYAAIPSTGASGARPRIMSDAFSAIIIVEL